jgi:hypothetical protein
MKFILFFIFFTEFLLGAEVLRVSSNSQMIAITQEVNRPWQINDRICVIQNGSKVDCGVVIKTKEKYSIVKLKNGSSLIGRGDQVILENRQNKPSLLISAEPLPVESNSEKTPFHLLSLGGTLGPGVFYPDLHFQRIIEPELAVGFMPAYINITSSAQTLSSVSLLATANYYPKEFYRKWWIHGAMGLAFMSTQTGTVQQQSAAFQALLAGGYRFKLDVGINVGVAVGFQYIHDPNFVGLTLNGVGLKPVILLDAGVNF